MEVYINFGSVYQFDITSGDNPSLSFIRGATYKFDYSSFTGHPVLFSSTNPDSITTAYTDGTSIASNVISFTVPHDAPDTLYYYCQNHPTSMNGSISITTDTKKADPYAWKNVLALPLVGISSDYSGAINSGSTTKPITLYGNVAGVTTSNFYGRSYGFDGNGDYLTTPGTTDFVFGTGDFTIEFWAWVNSTQNGTNGGFINYGDYSGAQCWEIILTGTTGSLMDLRIDMNGTDGVLAPQNVVLTNTWQHHVLQRSSGTLKYFLDGVEIDSTTHEVDYSNPSNNILRIGGRNGLTNYDMTGYMQDVRIYKGVAKYTSNFIPASTDPDILPDTPSGVSGSSKLAKITDGAVIFDGTSGTSMSIANSSDFNFGSGDWTVECYHYSFKAPGSGTNSLIGMWNSGSNRRTWLINLYNDYFRGYFSIDGAAGGSIYQVGDSTVKAGSDRWYHVALVRNGNNLYLFQDGKLIDTQDVTGQSVYNNTTDDLYIGSGHAGTVTNTNGYISNLRVVKGTALYTSDFTPPTAPLTNVTNTKLLCCQSNTSAGAAAVKPASEDWQPSGFTYWTAGMSQNWNQSSSSTSASGDYINVALPTSGKYYWESTLNDPSEFRVFGIQQGADFVAGYDDNTFGFYFNGAVGDPTAVFLTKNESGTSRGDAITHGTSAGDAFSDGEKVMWAWDADNDKIWLGRNGTWYASGDPESGTNASISGEDLSAASWYFKIGYNNEAGATNTLTLTNVTSTSSTNFDPVANGDAAATNFNPFTTDINTVRGQESGYATLSPVRGYLQTLSNGNLTGQTAGGWVGSTVDVSSGKYYVEFIPTSNTIQMFGICSSEHTSNAYPWQTAASKDVTYYVADGRVYVDAVNTGTTSAAAVGDTISLSLDTDSRTVQIRKNNILISTKTISQSTSYMFYLSDGGGTSSATVNFGQKPFKFPPPEGFQPLNAANVRPDTVIARPDQYVGIVTYTGNSSTNVITGLGFSPDFLWIKARTIGTYDSRLFDSVRGIDKPLYSSLASAEATGATNLTSFDSNGFTLGSPAQTNLDTYPFVAWAWNAGTSNTPISAGSLNSSFYDQSQTWSDDMSTSNGWTANRDGTKAFDSNTTLISGASNTWAQTDTTGGTVTWTPNGYTIDTADVIYVKAISSTDRLTVVGSNSTQSNIAPGTVDGVTNVYTVPTTLGTVTSLSVTNPSGLAGFSGIKVGGKVLVDTGVTPAVSFPSIASTVRANQSAGFSIVSYTGNATAGATVGHGLNAAPSFIIIKNRDSVVNWAVGHASAGFTKYLELNTTLAATPASSIWNDTAPSSTVVTLGSDTLVNQSTKKIIAYCFAPVEGYSAFGSYIGNGLADGPFVYTGFRPSWLMIKISTGTTSNWVLLDKTRDPYNVVENNLYADTSDAENQFDWVDFLSNGFKVRSTLNQANGSTYTYVYAAFAEAPSFNLYGAQSNAR